MRKGFIHVVPLVVFALLLVSGFSLITNNNIQRDKAAVGKVLSDKASSEGEDREDSKSESSSEDSSDSKDSSSNQNSDDNKPKVEVRSSGLEKPQKKEKPEVKKVENKSEFSSNKNGVQIEIRKNGAETQIQSGGFQMEYKNENGKIVTKIKDDAGNEVESEVEDEVEKEVESRLEEQDIKLATGSAGLGFEEKGRRVRTNFPLTVNPQTGELWVTTPNGVKMVSVLPSVAISNMIRGGVLTTTNSTLGGGGGEGTPSATAEAGLGSDIELTEVNNQPAFIISGFKQKKLLGLLPVNIAKQTVVSAENGQLLDVREGIFAKALDIFSF